MRLARAICIAALGLALALPAAAAERELELRLDSTRAVELHNLAGTVRLVPGDGEFVIRARVTAESDALADEVSLQTSQRGAVREVVVAYPARLSRLRYDGEEFRRINTSITYQGRKVQLSSSQGELLRVDLEILVPADAALRVRNGVGPVSAERVHGELSLGARAGGVRVLDGRGKLRAESGSGRITIESFRGDVAADAGSGRIEIENVLGRVEADTGSGNVSLRGIDGDIEVDTGSGSVTITDARAQRVEVDTGSGSVSLTDVSGSLDIDTGSGSVRGEGLVAGPDVIVDTGSGSVSLAGDLAAMRHLVVDTGSGSVDIRSVTPLSLRLDLRNRNGEFRIDIPALSQVESGRRNFRAVAGAGDGTARVSTGSGGIRISAP